ncbi:carboxylesterase family protein [Sphingomonas sp. AR_OL41]|uniref:carboxylesterase/lipase family protein n=1 Tax=Sphingomonas sp. AR_OL41 TaxID=3042729 RepID=UPI002481719A|nr:carboxylesterase family protein [Sphingomonas sp. AR_OL41]MDH7975884.1 carboxylesterase family protein [Sphingomonas sp. AR_OL41]
MSECVLNLQSGAVRGEIVGTVERFLGIPYAAPPVGQRRFAEPQSVAPWDGVRDGTIPGPNAPQRIRDVPGIAVRALVGNGWSEGDDYLTLNIWRPAGEQQCLPVMVFIHGGGFVLGSKDAPVQDGASFARDGVICVAINYRMGIDGFLPIPGVATNLGLRDMIAALRWVQDNAAAIGGDAGNVTAFGESAGAMAIADLMTSPLAKGLFRRAIIESGHGAMTRDVSVAQRLVAKLARMLSITPDKAGYAGVLPSQGMMDAIEKVSLPTTRLDLRDAAGFEPVFGISRFIPVHGDDVLPEKPLDALRKGAGAEVDLLIGTNAEEMNLYLVPSGVRDKVGRLLSWLALRRSIPRAWAILRAYGAGDGKRPGQALTDAMNDLVFRWPARRFAEEHRGRTHFYEFEWRSPLFGGELGAAHAMEVPFVFDALAAATGPEGLCGERPPQELATRVHGLWVEFARTGTLPWPEFDRETRQVYRLAAGEAVHEPVMPAAAYLP